MIGQVSKPRSVDYAVLAEMFEDAVATRRELLKLGFSGATLAQKCRPGGGWTRLQPGVYLLTGGKPSRKQLARAALLRAGPLAVITGLEAVRLRGVRRLPEDDRVHVLVPHGKGVASRDFMQVERTNRPWHGSLVNGLPVVSLARALIDAARCIDRLDVIRAMIADAVQRRLVSTEQLASELRFIRLGGTHLPRRVLDEIREGVRSAAEAWSISLIRRSGLPAPQRNVLIRDKNGKQIAIVDGWWGEVGMVWQIDSKEFHTSPEDYARTMAQHSALVAEGIFVVHTLPGRIISDPQGVIRELVRTYAAASQTPPPDVTATLFRPV